MSDHDDRAAAGQTREGSLDERLVLGVGEGSRLVEHDDGGIFENRAGKRHTLDLSAGKICPASPEHGIDALRQLRHDVVALGGGERRAHLRIRGVGPRGAHVVGKRLAEELVCLEHEGDVVHKLVWVDVAHVDASHEHTARGRIPKTRDERGARGLAAARGADECERAASGDVEAHAIDSGAFCPLVREAHIVEAHAVSRRVLERSRNGERLGLHDAPDASQRVGAHLRGLAHEHELGHRGGHYSREDRVEREVGHEPGEIRLPGGKQQRHG